MNSSASVLGASGARAWTGVFLVHFDHAAVQGGAKKIGGRKKKTSSGLMLHSHVQRRHVPHALVYALDDGIAQVVHPAAISDADHHRSRVSLQMSSEFVGCLEEVAEKPLGFCLLDRLVGLASSAQESAVEYLPRFPPLVTMGHREQGVVVGK